MEGSTENGWRVKLYQLNDGGQWDDNGTGFCACVVIEAHTAIVIKSEDDNDNILLESIIVDEDVYQRQGATIITFKDPKKLVDLALSFQEEDGCQEIWSRIAEIQGKFASDYHCVISQPHGDEYIVEGEDIVVEENVALPEVPFPDMSNLHTLTELFSFEESTAAIPPVESMRSPGWKAKLAASILKILPEWLAKLVALFNDAEDLCDMTSLKHIAMIVKGLNLLNDVEIFERLYSDDCYLDVMGILEYDPDNEKKNIVVSLSNQLSDPSPPVSPTEGIHPNPTVSPTEGIHPKSSEATTGKVEKGVDNATQNKYTINSSTKPVGIEKLSNHDIHSTSKNIVPNPNDSKQTNPNGTLPQKDNDKSDGGIISVGSDPHESLPISDGTDNNVSEEELKDALPSFLSNRPRYRKFLEEEAKFKHVIEISDPEVRHKIHQTFRLTYLKDVVLLRCLDDNTMSTLSALIHLNHNFILMRLQGDVEYLGKLFKTLKNPNLEEPKRFELLSLVREMCHLAKNLQQDDRDVFYCSLYLCSRNEGDTGGSIENRDKNDTESNATSTESTTPASATGNASDESLVSTGSKNVENAKGCFFSIFERLFAIGTTHGHNTSSVDVLPLSADSKRCCIEILSCVVMHDPQLLRIYIIDSKSSAHPAPPSRKVSNKRKRSIEEVQSGEIFSGKMGNSSLSLNNKAAELIKKKTDLQNKNMEKFPSLLWLFVSFVASEGDGGMRAEATGMLTSLLDIDAMDVIQRDAFLQIFYDHYMDWLIQPFEIIKESDDGSMENESGKSSKTTICELLRFCVQHHTFRIKFFILRNNVISKVLRLLLYRERYVVCSALRFVRACIGQQDEFYNRHLIKNNLLDPVFEAWDRNQFRNNLLDSAILELIEFIRAENVKSLVTYIIESKKMRSIFEQKDGGSAQILSGLLERYNQNNEDSRPFSNRQDLLHSRMTGAGAMESARRQQRFLDAQDEEMYFDDDNDDIQIKIWLMRE